MKIEMNYECFKDIMKSCKPYVAHNDRPPILQTIKLECNNGICTATALDGYKIINVKVQCNEDVEGVICIPIVKFPTKGYYVIIEDNENEIIFDFLTEKQVVRKIKEVFMDTTKLIPKDEPKMEIGFTTKLLKEALEGFTDEKIIRIEVISETKGFILRGVNKEALVLPVHLR